QAVHADDAHRRRHRLRDRLPLLQRHRRRGRLGLPRQGRDVQPGAGLDPRRRQRHVQGSGDFRRHSRPLAASQQKFCGPKSAQAPSRHVYARVVERLGPPLGHRCPVGRRARLGALSPLRLVGPRAPHAPARRARRAPRSQLEDARRKSAPPRRARGAQRRRRDALAHRRRARRARRARPGQAGRGRLPGQRGAALMLLGFKLRRLLWRARRVTLDLWGAATTVGAAALVGAGWFPDLRASSADVGPIVAACTLGALVVIKVAARLRALPQTERDLATDDGRRDLKRDLELGAALVVATYVTLELSGGLGSPIYPLVYAIVAFLVTFHRRLVGVPLVVVTFGMEALLYRAAIHAGTPEPRARQEALSHATFIAFFALTHFVFLQAEVMRQRRQHKSTLARAIRTLRDEARDFRLISSSLAADPKARSRESDEERLAVGAVQAIHDTIYFTIDLLKKSLELNTCVLLWLDDTGERLKIKELVTDSDCVVETAINADAGA